MAEPHSRSRSKTYWRIAIAVVALLLLVPPAINLLWITVSPSARLLLGGEGERVTVRTDYGTFTGTLRQSRLAANDVVGFFGLRIVIDDVMKEGAYQPENSINEGTSMFLSPWNLDEAELVNSDGS